MIKKVGSKMEVENEESEIMKDVYIESLLINLVKLKSENSANKNLMTKRNFNSET